MYAPVLQSGSSSDAASGLQCIILLVFIAITWAVLANLKSKTKNASAYTKTITSTLPREQIVKLVQGFFPKSIVSSTFNWKLSWPTPDKLTMSGYYLTNGQGCLAMIVTGILPGALLIRYVMGPTEQVSVDFSKFQTAGELTLEAKGLRAQQEVDNLITKLGVGNPPATTPT
jgi:hypothetical protein